MTKLSIIIPFRCESESTSYLISRLTDLLSSLPTDLPLEFMVVDSGSHPLFQEQCKDICNQYNAQYLYHDTLGKPFSIGACRDYGVQHAKGAAVTFLDVDLRVADDFWPRLLQLMEAWGISKYKKSFLAIPCMYLTQEGTVEFLNSNSNLRFMDFYLRYLQGDKSAVENLALCSSVMIVDRFHYLSVGGHDIEFRGHGYEDFELYHRLVSEENIIPKTSDYYLDQKTWDTFSYTGFRSHLAIIARPALMMNLFVVHLWHSRPKDVSFYSTKSITHNRTMWVDKFKKFAETGFHPNPLPIKKENILFFGKPYTNASKCLKDIFPFLGNVIYTSEYSFVNIKNVFLEHDFEYMLKTNNISKIIFFNPYGNSVRLEIYNWCKKTNFPFYCYERGALPDSWFLDPSGFNSDSESYLPIHWSKTLSKTETEQVESYIKECVFGSNFLEKQSERIGGEALANKLQLGSKKVLFVPLQRPSDTVIQYMAGNIRSFSRFTNVIDQLAKSLKSKGWVVLCKKHPLETEVPRLQYAEYVPDDTHFIDLLELSDRVALINSGVGIYSMMMEKPTYIFGDAFYAFEGINKSIKYQDFENDDEIDDLAKEIVTGYEVDKTKMQQFLHYLVYSFYSFGKTKTISRKEADGSLRTITTGIDFYNLKLDGNVVFDYEPNSRPKLSLSAPIFERYALDIHLKKKAAASKKGEAGAKAAVKASAPAKAATAKAPAPTKTAAPAKAPVQAKTTTPVKEIGSNKEQNTSLSPSQKETLDHVSNYKKSKSEIRRLKMAKFKRDPHRFFADSSNPLVRLGSLLFKEKN